MKARARSRADHHVVATAWDPWHYETALAVYWSGAPAGEQQRRYSSSRKATEARGLDNAHREYCQLVALPEGTGAEQVADALKEQITTLPAQLRRSPTWDQGSEMSEHRRFAVESGVEVYFCDPRSPWQRGSNENTNGLLRQYFPKGESLAAVSQQRLDEVARKLNGRPRKTLGFVTPAEKLAELIDGLEEASAER